MINHEDIIRIGQFRKTHGTKGEITFSLSDVMADSTRNPLLNDLCHFLICEFDGIFVPFRIENCRFNSDTTAYIQLKNIDSEQLARLFINKEVYYPKKYISEISGSDSFTWDYFIGFSLIDEQYGKIGRIIEIDKTTINILFIVENNKEEIMIPAVDEFIIRVNEKQKELIVRLPEGLIE